MLYHELDNHLSLNPKILIQNAGVYSKRPDNLELKPHSGWAMQAPLLLTSAFNDASS